MAPMGSTVIGSDPMVSAPPRFSKESPWGCLRSPMKSRELLSARMTGGVPFEDIGGTSVALAATERDPTRRLVFPSAAQRFVNCDQVRRSVLRALHQGIFGIIQSELSHQHAQEVGLSLAVEL